MYLLNDELPIIALSTGTTNSALALLRLNGFSDPTIFQKFFSCKLSSLVPQHATLCNILDGDKVVDEVVLTYFAAPRSYTGDHLFEISVHGNQLNVQRIIHQFISSGLCRLARAGEFTYRALLNRKLSLSQVEGLEQMLNATSSLMLDQGLAALHGDLHRDFLELHQSFIRLKASVELSIDFLEDIGEEQSKNLFDESLARFLSLINSLYYRSQGDLNQLTSPSIVLLGRTNAGKSSLFNFILSSSRSIVSAVHGTTRDYVSEYLFLDGNHFRLIDTAGMRISDDTVESLGIERSYQQMQSAFFRILVINPFDFDIAEFSHFDSSVDLLLFTHSDLPEFAGAVSSLLTFLPPLPYCCLSLSQFEYGSIGPVLKGGPIEPILLSGSIEPVTRAEFLALLQHMVSLKYQSLCGDGPILVARHRASIGSIYTQALEFKELCSHSSDIGILSHELLRLEASISDLIGIITPDQVLASIFSNFCIGK